MLKRDSGGRRLGMSLGQHCLGMVGAAPDVSGREIRLRGGRARDLGRDLIWGSGTGGEAAAAMPDHPLTT